MENLFTIDNLFTLAMLILLQAVLGFDNLLYISIESKRVPEDRQSYVRRMGIGMAVGLRIVLLFLLMSAIQYFQEPFFSLDLKGVLEGTVNVHALIVLIGGVFIMYTAIKEIMHMLSVEDIEKSEGTSKRTVGSALFWIILMNLIFSFDSILSALALSDTFLVIATSIVVSGLMMIYLADHVAEFLKTNRMYEVLGLFILFIVEFCCSRRAATWRISSCSGTRWSRWPNRRSTSCSRSWLRWTSSKAAIGPSLWRNARRSWNGRPAKMLPRMVSGPCSITEVR